MFLRTFLTAVLSVFFAQNAPLTFRVDVRLVSLEVEVTDSSGRLVTDLPKTDFLVYEDGVLQEVRNFAPVDTPYSILSLFDCSNSLREKWPYLTVAMTRLVQGLRPQDRVAVVAFGTGLKPLLDWTPRSQWSTQFQIPRDSRVCSNTDFYGAMEWAAETLQKTTGRRGVIVFSDGAHSAIPVRLVAVGGLQLPRVGDIADDGNFKNTLERVRSAGTRFYFVAVNTDLNPIAISEALQPSTDYSPLSLYNLQQVRSRMEQLAVVSGGRIVFPQTDSDYVPLFEQIAAELGSSYSLAYAPSTPDDGKYHRIEVRLRAAGLKVKQSREGYDGK